MRTRGSRGLLAILAVCTLVGCGAARPASVASIDLRSSTYTDDDATTVTSSTVSARANATDALSVSARYLVDFTSSASVDVVSAATGRWKEYRHEVEGASAWADGTNNASAGYIYSQENDWRSHTINLGVSRDFRQHNLTLGAGGSWVTNAIGRAQDANFAEHLQVIGGSLQAVVVLGTKDIVSATYAVSLNDGYQASPYRFVYFEDPSAPGQILSQAEAHPEHRVRHALALRWNRHVQRDAAVRSHVRGYADDWGITSVTAGTEYVVGLSEHLEAATSIRAYYQQHARFYEDVYTRRRRYMTADRELSTFTDVFGGARVSYHLGPVGFLDELRAELKIVGFRFVFFDFSRLPDRNGLIAEAGLGARF